MFPVNDNPEHPFPESEQVSLPERKSPWRKRLMILGGLVTLVLAIGAGVLAIDWWMDRSAQPRIHHRVEGLPQRQVALILGARVYPSGRLSAMLEDRVQGGVELYKAGRVQKLLMSGDNSETHYDEVTAMRRRAIELGVPSDDVVRDFAGFRTWDSLVRAREIWDLQELIIVSQKFHLVRALFIARGLGINAHGYVATRPGGYGGSHRRSRIREVPARAKAWFDRYIVRPAPRFLGPREGLSGDAQRDTPPLKGRAR